MGEKYNDITQLIQSIAENNPYITKDKLAKIKSMYNGDDRPLEDIATELKVYSDEVRNRAEETKEAKEVVEVNTIKAEETVFDTEEHPNKVEKTVFDTEEKTASSSNNELTTMITDYESEENKKQSNNSQLSPALEKPKQLVKTPINEDQRVSISGYGGATILCALFSIVGIILAVVVVLAQ